MRCFWRATGGSATIEMGLIAPAFLLLLVGILDVALTFLVGASLDNAVALGARRFAQTRDPVQSAVVVEDNLLPFARPFLTAPTVRFYDSLSGVDVTSPAQGHAGPGPTALAARFEVTCDWPFLSRALAEMGGGNARLTRVAVVVFP